MPMYDMPEYELRQYRSSVESPPDLDDFWSRTLREARAARRDTTVEPVDSGLRLVESYDVTFSGFGGDPIRAWFHRPVATADQFPVVVSYQGYGSGRGLPHQVGPWVLAGYPTLEVDTRGQGSAVRAGHTPDPAGSGPAHPGYLTRGLLQPDDYYYRRVFTDAVLAVDCARSLPGADPTRVILAGGSQGGGISLAVAGLADEICAVMSDVPFLCDFGRAITVSGQPPYTEIANYLAVHRDHVERATQTLAYFDACVLAPKADAPALFSVALMDQICPPSTVYAAYNAYGGPKEMRSYPFNDHEGGGALHESEQLRWLKRTVPIE